VLYPVLGRPMIEYVLDTLQQCSVDRILVVVGYRSDQVRETLSDFAGIEFVEQTEQLGTGHAVKMCRDQLLGHHGPVLIVTGDSPLTLAESVSRLFEEFETSRPACILGTLDKANPRGLGRILRDDAGRFLGIVEEKDASDEQQRITEVNMSTYLFDAQQLVGALDLLQNDNRQREFYITDCPGILQQQGQDVRAWAVLQPCEALSINTVQDVAIVEAELRKMGH
jgi:bifunctional UDP-N-acetylglucosamine pyrophosphorylase / glucosamine-1-phosphate N-acetyltransferase